MAIARGFVATICLVLSLFSCEQDVGGPIGDCFPGETPACGQPCYNPCGYECSGCLDVGRDYCAGGAIRRCKTNCIETMETCSEPDACAGSICAESVADCEAVRTAYENELLFGRSVVAVVRTGSSGWPPGEYGPGCPGDCAIVPGDCESGLETCWLVGWRTSEMDRLAKLYQRLGCAPSPVCDCPDRETELSCVGVPDADGNFHNACVTPER